MLCDNILFSFLVIITVKLCVGCAKSLCSNNYSVQQVVLAFELQICFTTRTEKSNRSP